MRYTQTVSAFAVTDYRVKLRYLFGGVLGCLLIMFAVAAKVAPYHPHQQAARSIAATKVLENDAITLPDPSRPQTPFFLYLVSVVLTSGASATWQLSKDEPASSALIWFSPYLFVRPPPTL